MLYFTNLKYSVWVGKYNGLNYYYYYYFLMLTKLYHKTLPIVQL